MVYFKWLYNDDDSFFEFRIRKYELTEEEKDDAVYL